MLANVGGYVIVSLLSHQSAIERIQAVLFVDVFRHAGAQSGSSHLWRGSATVPDLKNLLARFIGRSRAERAIAAYGRVRGLHVAGLREAEPGTDSLTERVPEGSIRTPCATVLVATAATGLFEMRPAGR